MPAPHARHSVVADAPTLVEYVPAAQFAHETLDVAPVVLKYVATGHRLQTRLLVAASDDENEPAAQLKHVLTPPVEYLPAAQLTHVVDDDAPASAEAVPTPQLVQTRLDVAAKADEYDPAAHPVHDADTEAPKPVE